MGTVAFPGGSAPNETASFISAATGVYSDSLTVPSVKQASNGTRPVYFTRVYAYVSGRGGARTAQIQVGGAITPGFTVASAGSAQSTPWQSIAGFAYSGSAFRTRISCNGAFYFGRGGSGSTHSDSGASSWGSALVGVLEFGESPSAPRSLSAATVAPTVARASWTAPADLGGLALQGYTLIVGTNPSITENVQTFTLGNVTTYDVTVAPGTTYYFVVRARNAATTAASTFSTNSNVVSLSTGAAPSAPQSVVASAGAGYFDMRWATPADDGGVTVSGYKVDISTNSAFTGIIATATLPAGARDYTFPGPTPGSTLYGRVRAVNAVGEGANAAAVSAPIPARTALDVVHAASVMVSEGTQVSLVSSAAGSPVISLVARAFPGNVPVTIASNISGFYTPGGARNLDLVADAAGNLYVVGVQEAARSNIVVARFPRTGPSSWGPVDASNSQALTSTGNNIIAVAAAYVPGSGSTPKPSIMVIARRAGMVGAGAVSFALVDPAKVTGGDLFRSSGNDPTWLSVPPTTAAPNSATVDITPLTSGSQRLAVLSDGFAVIDIINGAVTSVSKAASGTATAAPYARVVGIGSSSFALFRPSGTALAWSIINTAGSTLASGSIVGLTAVDPRAWDAYYDRASALLRIYSLKSGSANIAQGTTISVATYATTGPTDRLSTGSAASNRELRLPHGIVDERSVAVEVANGGALAVMLDGWGNIAPAAPALVDKVGIDGSQANAFAWAFGDPNPADTQRAFQLQVQRVSDSVTVHDTGTVVSSVSSRTVAAGIIANGQAYRWRVKTWDALNYEGAYSGWDEFTASALGTLAITYPATDNPAGLDTASLGLMWSYTQGDGYVQTQRRVRVVRTADSVVLSDTGMQANTASTYTVTNLPSDVEVRIELSVVTNAPGAPTVGPVSRKVTASYGTPMPPDIELEVGESYIAVIVTNPTPSGDRPEVVRNIITRRVASVGDFVAIGSTDYSGTFLDYSVASGRAYDYQVKGLTE